VTRWTTEIIRSSYIADGLVSYWPRHAFTVDGIVYDRRSPYGVYTTRAMISVLPDDGGAAARMRYDQPPTEYEMRIWLATGLEPN
jgi:hypothetical protein